MDFSARDQHLRKPRAEDVIPLSLVFLTSLSLRLPVALLALASVHLLHHSLTFSTSMPSLCSFLTIKQNVCFKTSVVLKFKVNVLFF